MKIKSHDCTIILLLDVDGKLQIKCLCWLLGGYEQDYQIVICEEGGGGVVIDKIVGNLDLIKSSFHFFNVTLDHNFHPLTTST